MRAEDTTAPNLPPAAEGVTLYSDSTIVPKNPGGRLTWAFWAQNERGEVLTEQWGEIGQDWEPALRTNNAGEYTAALEALRWAYRQGHTLVTLRTDSQLLYNQITGVWSCNDARLHELITRMRKAGEVMQVTYEWVPRTANWRADELSRRPYQQYTGDRPDPALIGVVTAEKEEETT